MPPPTYKTNFFISRRGPMAAVAREVADVLEAAGLTTRIQDYDFKLGGDFVEEMGNALRECRDLIVIHSADYWDTHNTRKEFTNFFAKMAQSAGAARIIVLRCDEAQPAGLMQAIVYADLFATTDPAERRALILAAAKGQSTHARPGASMPAGAPAATISNIPISIPAHFFGREDALADIHAALTTGKNSIAITAVHGMRGVGKTVLAAAYAIRHAADYRATWWLRAETASSLRADLTGLGVRLGWVAADAPEAPAVATVLERLRSEGQGILLIYDNALRLDDPKGEDALRPYIPKSTAARLIITSNNPAWSNVASRLELPTWLPGTGADFLLARTEQTDRGAAEFLSSALGGLPLAHEMAGAYCQQTGITLAAYAARFAATPAPLLDDAEAAPGDYHQGTTVTRTFTLAMEAAARRHPAAEPLLTHCALLAPEPIPLFLFQEGRETLGEPLATLLADDGLDKAVAALLAFALIDREPIEDERDPTIKTDSIRLHRLVREVVAARPSEVEQTRMRAAMIEGMATVYPGGVYNTPSTWPRARSLDGLALALVGHSIELPPGAETAAADVLNGLSVYRQGPLAAQTEARPLSERALAIRIKLLGPEHPRTAISYGNLAAILEAENDLAGALPLRERALAIHEKTVGEDHSFTATSVNNLAEVHRYLGNRTAARWLLERSLRIREKIHGPNHPETASSLNNLSILHQELGQLDKAQELLERAVVIYRKVLPPEHPETAISLCNLALLLEERGNPTDARSLLEEAVAILELTFGPNHPTTSNVRRNLAGLGPPPS